ncbi:hypothetical protein DFH08DRAFT_1039711 [Mycena albidolilacea]|uniref:Uncharacterized protein n=1 Tax=Mycena albidolilacea TaxID=1033008 RepID=A0AAD7EFF3_9AGAR|nr:hypothetical protein DFH08DRAFT_1039711 [Mycena albidolilacea]
MCDTAAARTSTASIPLALNHHLLAKLDSTPAKTLSVTSFDGGDGAGWLVGWIGLVEAHPLPPRVVLQAPTCRKSLPQLACSVFALSAGWKVVHVTKTPVSLQRRARAGSGSTFFDVPRAGRAAGAGNTEVGEMEIVERARSHCGMPTFGSRVDLPFGAEPASEEKEAFTAVR